jgi:hypothetical protein
MYKAVSGCRGAADAGGEISCMILGLHHEADTDKITVLACDRTDRSGSEKIIFALTGAYTVNPDRDIIDSLWFAGSTGFGGVVGSGLDWILIRI